MYIYVPAHVHTHVRAHYTHPTQIGRHTQTAYLLTRTYQAYTFVLKVHLVETWISIKKFTIHKAMKKPWERVEQLLLGVLY